MDFVYVFSQESLVKKTTSLKWMMPESLYTVLVSHLKVILFFTERKKVYDKSIWCLLYGDNSHCNRIHSKPNFIWTAVMNIRSKPLC